MIIDTSEVEFTYTQSTNNASDNELSLLAAALERLETKELRIREAYEGGIDTLEEFKQNKLRLQKEREQILEEMKAYEQIPEQEPKVSKDELLKRIRTVYDLIQSPEVPSEIKGNALRQVLQKIEYDGKTKTMQFHYYV